MKNIIIILTFITLLSAQSETADLLGDSAVSTLTSEFSDSTDDSIDNISETPDSIESLEDELNALIESDEHIAEIINDDVSNEFEDTLETTVLVDSIKNVSEEIPPAIEVVVEEPIVPSEKIIEIVSDSSTKTKFSGKTENKKVGILVLLMFVLLAVIGVAIYLVRRKKNSGNFLTSTRISIMDREVQLVCQYIEEHYADQELDAEKICEALSTGKQFVETLFKKELDMTLEAFITHVRIHHAVNNINEGFNGESEELMALSGYIDFPRFEHDFFTVTGVRLSSLINSY